MTSENSWYKLEDYSDEVIPNNLTEKGSNNSFVAAKINNGLLVDGTGYAQFDSPDITKDIFTDATGANNTVDVADTTAEFDTDKYERNFASGAEVEYSENWVDDTYTRGATTLLNTINVSPTHPITEFRTYFSLAKTDGANITITARWYVELIYQDDTTSGLIDCATYSCGISQPLLYVLSNIYTNYTDTKEVKQIKIYYHTSPNAATFTTNFIIGFRTTDVNKKVILDLNDVSLKTITDSYVVVNDMGIGNSIPCPTGGKTANYDYQGGTIDASLIKYRLTDGVNYTSSFSLNTKNAIDNLTGSPTQMEITLINPADKTTYYSTSSSGMSYNNTPLLSTGSGIQYLKDYALVLYEADL